MDAGSHVGMVLLDLKIAFDIVDHTIVHWSSYVFRWFHSYLVDSQQLVAVSGTLLSGAEIKCGILQGSILGSILFLIYVNDMFGLLNNKLLSYADDSTILVVYKRILNIADLLKKELEKVSDWQQAIPASK